MIFHRFEDDDGNTVLELDEEGIDYLITGLEQLRACEPGHELTSPTIVGDFEAMGLDILRRA